MFKLPKVLTLNYKTWRCGGQSGSDRRAQLGVGETKLLNYEGYQCCLGQWCEQAGVSRDSLLNVAIPSKLSIKNRVKGFDRGNKITSTAMHINDGRRSIEEKIVALKQLLKSKGHTIRLINAPAKIRTKVSALLAKE